MGIPQQEDAMCEPTERGWMVCACGDPTCIRGVLPWEPCQNPDALMATELAAAWRTQATHMAGQVRR